MTPQIITSNTELKQFIPNVSIEVEGEDTLFAKMKPDILAAENFFTSEVSSIAAMGTEDILLTLAKRIVATKAFLMAIPKLDLVLTANGFGIVSNGNVAPASKERVDRLIQTLDIQLGQDIDLFIRNGLTIATWRAADQGGKRFTQTIFYALELESIITNRGNIFTAYKQHLPVVIGVQNMIAHNYLSEEIMQSLISYTGSASEPAAYYQLRYLLQPVVSNLVIARIDNKECNERFALRDVVNFIRTHQTDFPNWGTSYAGQRYKDYSFKNKAASAAFWL